LEKRKKYVMYTALIALALVALSACEREIVIMPDSEDNRKTDAVIAALRAQGVAEKDIRTTSFNIYPQRDYKGNNNYEIVGYQVNNTVSATLRDLDSVGKTLQLTIEAGANNISGISFTLDDPEPFRDEARTKAVEDARRRAEGMAEAAGIELGKVINISESSYSGYVVARGESYDAAMAKEEVPIEPGELELTVQVSMVFAINE